MFRTEKTVGLLKSIAMIAGLAILLWSLGLPSLQFATAANLSSISDTISDSAPSASANHVVRYTMPSTATALTSGDTIDITFSGFTLTGIDDEDVNLVINGATSTEATDFIVDVASETMTITLQGTETIVADDVIVIYVGLNATAGTAPDSQIVNPSSEGSFVISVDSDSGADSGETRVVILSSVEVSASVDTVFTFAVAGVGANVAFNGTATTTGATGSTTIPFGTLTAGQATTTAQQLTVNTNASNGYVVTVQTDGPLESSAGGVIDGFDNGSDIDTPATWDVPDGTINDPATWGHWGFVSDDTDTTRDPGDEFGVNEYAAASTSPRVVMSHDGPANGTGVGVGTTTVGYKVEITALQEAGDDYSTTLTYIATPTF